VTAGAALTRDELLAAVLRERFVIPASRGREAPVQRVGRLPADPIAVIEHRRAAATRADTARSERAYRRAARLAAAVPTETPLPPAAVRQPYMPDVEHAARLLAGVGRTPKEPTT
jgi:hypothetical protein